MFTTLKNRIFLIKKNSSPQDLQDKIHKEHKTSSYINPNTMQANILVHVSPQILELPLPPELQPL